MQGARVSKQLVLWGPLVASAATPKERASPVGMNRGRALAPCTPQVLGWVSNLTRWTVLMPAQQGWMKSALSFRRTHPNLSGG